MSDYETDESLDDGLGAQFRDAGVAPIDASNNRRDSVSSDSSLKRVPVKSAAPRRPAKPLAFRVKRGKREKPAAEPSARRETEVDDADPFSDNNKVDRGSSWI